MEQFTITKAISMLLLRRDMAVFNTENYRHAVSWGNLWSIWGMLNSVDVFGGVVVCIFWISEVFWWGCAVSMRVFLCVSMWCEAAVPYRGGHDWVGDEGEWAGGEGALGQTGTTGTRGSGAGHCPEQVRVLLKDSGHPLWPSTHQRKEGRKEGVRDGENWTKGPTIRSQLRYLSICSSLLPTHQPPQFHQLSFCFTHNWHFQSLSM